MDPNGGLLSPKPKVYWAITLSKPCRHLCDWYNDLVDFDDVNATKTKIRLIVVPCVLIDFQCVTSVAVWIRTVRHRHQTVNISTGITRSPADADKPARRVSRSVKVTKHSTIPHVMYSFLLCNSNFVFRTRRFYDIRLQKMSWPWNGVKNRLENRVRGPSRSLEMSPCDRAHMTSYWRSIVTMALSRVISEIFNVEKSRSQGHWEWYQSIDCVWFPISVL